MSYTTLTDDERDGIAEAYVSDEPLHNIALRFNTSEFSVEEVRRRYGLPRRQVSHKDRVDADAVAQRSGLPADTRSLTARLCGDPLPGRSALDRGGRRQWAPPTPQRHAVVPSPGGGRWPCR